MNSGGNDENATTTPRRYVRPAPRKSANGNAVSDANDDDQPVLMEAKLVEMIASLRQLIHSNGQLEEALRECRDEDLLQALEENDGVIERKCDDARILAAKLSRHGVDISLEDKIPQYNGALILKQMKEPEMNKQSKDSGLYL
mmetsp:Transcript_18677/g.40080  ORF Transcript_18677/g.40080 Transcript_18677/m.40080 type:complete len:143 (-) Transcript_18677:44-472(-)|eukprot:CAMPEP_0172553022 /NCGR_PEP_ID=MMETSP1067-20121228/47971_1 /TAXON_ID=265564 ORGANISM="Thalassiosira punctigera, Strain Tpunct2005C2" /NCGR_SAMPLE_ID=MMETSP1067 /ASSEMBLY_ACC=CAM_ASM_000444 /LENGTH=142 /DNA_ID=CAMNT_0013341115 /DNA_START=36 /DNA_END=464 /DNA_ORIENTATION=+